MTLHTDINYQPVSWTDTRLERYLAEIRSLYTNGGAYSASVEATDHAVFDSAYRNDVRGMKHLLTSFLQQPSTRASIPALKIPNFIPESFVSTWIGRYQFEGLLTDVLLIGGAYHRYAGTIKSARDITRDCAEAICDALFEAFGIFSIEGAWTRAFFDVAWDYTFALYSVTQRRWLILWMTDTD